MRIDFPFMNQIALMGGIMQGGNQAAERMQKQQLAERQAEIEAARQKLAEKAESAQEQQFGAQQGMEQQKMSHETGLAQLQNAAAMARLQSEQGFQEQQGAAERGSREKIAGEDVAARREATQKQFDLGKAQIDSEDARAKAARMSEEWRTKYTTIAGAHLALQQQALAAQAEAQRLAMSINAQSSMEDRRLAAAAKIHADEMARQVEQIEYQRAMMQRQLEAQERAQGLQIAGSMAPVLQTNPQVGKQVQNIANDVAGFLGASPGQPMPPMPNPAVPDNLSHPSPYQFGAPVQPTPPVTVPGYDPLQSIDAYDQFMKGIGAGPTTAGY